MSKWCLIPLLSLLVASHLVIPSSCDPDPKTQALINQICFQTDDNAFCQDIFSRNYIAPNTGLEGLTKLTISASLRYARYVERFIQKSGAAEKNPQLKHSYELCERNYQRVVDLMGGADFEVSRSNFTKVVEILELCNMPIILCQNAIGDIVGDMRENNKKMRVLLTMGLYEGRHL